MSPSVEQPIIERTKSSLAVVLIGPDEGRRRTLARAFEQHQATIVGELGGYPGINQLSKVIEVDCDVVVVDLDADPDTALDVVENICGRNPALTVMVYSRRQDPELLVRCMRAGAREFLTGPLTAESLAESVVRASARRLELKEQKRVAGKVLVFWGAKGGAGVTTLASNFAVALKIESGAEVALVDLHAELGDVAVVLGLAPRFTVSDALRNAGRLDIEFISTLLTEHKSGLQVLAASDEYEPAPLGSQPNVAKLLYLLRSRFPYVVVDAGPSLGAAGNDVFDAADIVYLVAQAEIPAVRNTQRLIAHIQQRGSAERKVEVVFNRYDSRRMEIDEHHIAKALGVPVKWKVPNDFNTVRRSLNTGTPLVTEAGPVSRVLFEMAREACGKRAQQTKRKWGLFS